MKCKDFLPFPIMMLPGVETRAWSKDVPAQTKKSLCHAALCSHENHNFTKWKVHRAWNLWNTEAHRDLGFSHTRQIHHSLPSLPGGQGNFGQPLRWGVNFSKTGLWCLQRTNWSRVSLPWLILAAGNGDGRWFSETVLGFLPSTGITLLKSFTTCNESTLLISLKVRVLPVTFKGGTKERTKEDTGTAWHSAGNPTTGSTSAYSLCFSQCHLEKLRVQWH